MSTPEGKVKDQVKKRLIHHKVYPHTSAEKHPDLVGTFYMPAAGPFSVHGIHDFVGCWEGVFFSIETKAPDNPEDETWAQASFRVQFTRAGGVCFTGVRDASVVDKLAEIVEARTRAYKLSL